MCSVYNLSLLVLLTSKLLTIKFLQNMIARIKRGGRYATSQQEEAREHNVRALSVKRAPVYTTIKY